MILDSAGEDRRAFVVDESTGAEQSAVEEGLFSEQLSCPALWQQVNGGASGEGQALVHHKPKFLGQVEESEWLHHL